MWLKWKRFTFGIVLFASLSLFLFGCGDFGGAPTQPTPTPVSKSLSGIVSDPGTGMPVAHATVTAYAIDANGAEQKGAPLSISVQSDANGKYVLNLPDNYEGQVMVEATLPASAKVTDKQVSSLVTGQTIRALLPKILKSQSDIPPAMISLATEMLVQYIENNKAGVFSPANIQIALDMLEAYFGSGFTQTPPPSGGTAATGAQQDLLVMIRALNKLTGVTIADLVTLDPSNMMKLVNYSAALTAAEQEVITALISSGTIPAGYTPSPITPVTDPDIPTYTISGTVSLNGAGLAGVTLTVTGTGTGTVTTDASGTYTITSVRAGNYTITPFLAGYVFTPVSSSVVVSTANVSGQNFTALLNGSVTGTTTYPNGTVTVTTTYPDGTVTVTTTYPDGTVSVSTTYPNGTVTVSTTYPNGTVTGGTTYPSGTVIVSTTYPNGTITVTTTYPNGTISVSTTYPTGTVIGGTTYPSGTVIVTTTYPNGTITVSTTYPSGTVTGGTTYPSSTVTVTTTYPNGTITVTTTYPTGTVTATTTYPSGTVTVTTTYPNGSVTVATTYPSGTVTGGISYPFGSLTGTLLW